MNLNKLLNAFALVTIVGFFFLFLVYKNQLRQIEAITNDHVRYVELRDSMFFEIKDAVGQVNNHLIPSLDSLIAVLSGPEMQVLQHESGHSASGHMKQDDIKGILADLDGYRFHLTVFDDLTAKANLWGRPWEKSGWMEEFLWGNNHWQIASIHENRRDIPSLLVLHSTATLAASQNFLMNYNQFTEQIKNLQKYYREYDDIAQRLSALKE